MTKLTTSLVTVSVGEGLTQRENSGPGEFRATCIADGLGWHWRPNCERNTQCFEKRANSPSTKL